MVKLDNLTILNCLNDYLPKKTATILSVVSKITKKTIKIKNYRSTFLKLYVSDLVKISMFVESSVNHCTFYDIFHHLYIFKYVVTRFHHWNAKHWAILNTFLIYRYLIRESNSLFPFMAQYRWYINNDLIDYIELNCTFDIEKIYYYALMFPYRNIRELVMI
jgi:hypothetical protein